MFPIGVALLVVGSLVAWAADDVDKKRRNASEVRRVSELAKKGKSLKLDEAEDGAVLARRYGMKPEEIYFTKLAVELKKSRGKV